MLILQHIQFYYDINKPLLEDINIHILAGDRILVQGPSGAGKSTLLKVMSGLESPKQGSYRLNISGSTKKSFIFQDHQLVDYLTVTENILLPLWCAEGRYPEEKIDAVVALLDTFGLKNLASLKANELSAREQQLVGIIRALMNSPQIIFADEPTSQLDDKTTLSVVTIMSQYAKQNGATLITVSNDPEFVTYFDRVYRMHNHHLERVE